MKFLHYILRNVRRNPVRSLLTVASTAITLFLMVSMASFASVNAEVSRSMRTNNRLVVMNAQGFAGMVPIARVREIAALPGVVAASPFCWFGGKYGEEVMPFAQFGVDPQVIFTVYDELTVPPDPLRAFQDDKAGCVIGDKLAKERGLMVGDPFPLKADLYPFDLTLTIRGIYDGPANRDRRICMFHWDYLDEGLKRLHPFQISDYVDFSDPRGGRWRHEDSSCRWFVSDEASSGRDGSADTSPATPTPPPPARTPRTPLR